MPHQQGKPDWSGGSSGGGPGLNPGKGGGKPPGAGVKKGELFGDQLVFLRDLDPTDGFGGNGEHVLDTFNPDPQPIAVGYDPAQVSGGDTPAEQGLFPIYFTDPELDGDYEIPADDLPFVQEVELERANVARAPFKVQQKALLAALEKIDSADSIGTDPAGRIIYTNSEGSFTIDAPLECLGLYMYLMGAVNRNGDPVGGTEAGSWPDVTENWDDVFKGLLGDDPTDPDWDPSALLGAAWSKEGEITLDAMLYQNFTVDVNKFNFSTGDPDYFEFSDPIIGELYDYDREATYQDTYLQWIAIDPVTGDPEFYYGSAFCAVFGGEQWADEYLLLDDKGDEDPGNDEFVYAAADLSGVNDFAQSADDARAVINFMHTYGAVEIPAIPPGVDPQYICSDTNPFPPDTSMEPVLLGSNHHLLAGLA